MLTQPGADVGLAAAVAVAFDNDDVGVVDGAVDDVAAAAADPRQVVGGNPGSRRRPPAVLRWQLYHFATGRTPGSATAASAELLSKRERSSAGPGQELPHCFGSLNDDRAQELRELHGVVVSESRKERAMVST
jgi:hypothetical protein